LKKQQPSIQQLETIFFSTLDALRGVWRTSNATIILFSIFFFKRMLALHKEGIFSLDVSEKTLAWSKHFRESVVENPTAANQDLIAIFTHFSKKNPPFKNIFMPFVMALEQEKNSQHLLQLILMLEEQDFSTQAIPVAAFGDFFNSCLYKVARQTGKKGGKYTTPRFINALIAALAKPTPGEKIYDPTVGQGGTLLAMAQNARQLHFLGQERKIYTWALAKMNLFANGYYRAKIAHGNSLTDDAFAETKVDIAVGHFPFGAYLPTLDVKDQAYLMIPFDVSAPQVPCNNLFIQLMLDKLNDRGRLLVVLPIQSLTKEKEARKIREFLVRRDWLEAVITLPFGLLPTTGVPICILIINKQKSIERREHIVFINGANLDVKMASKLNRSLTQQHIKLLTDAYETLSTDALELQNCIARVPLHQIILNNYNLDAKSYASPFISRLKKLEEQGQLIELQSVFKAEAPALWYNDAPSKSLPYVRTDNLSKSISNYQLHVDEIPTTDDYEHVIGQLVSQDTLLVNRAGKKLLASYFEFKDQAIIVNENIMTFQVDTNQINIEYLMMQLFDDLFLQQLDMYKKDYQHKEISEEQFVALKINLPALDEQQQLVKEQKMELLKSKEQTVERLRLDLNLGRQKAQDEQYKIISSLQHELGNRLPTILTEFKNLTDYLQEKVETKENISFSEPIYPLFEEEDPNDIDTLGQVIERITQTLTHSINTLDSTSDIIKADRGKMNLEQVSINTFLHQIRQLYAQEQLFEIWVEIEEDENGKERPIELWMDQGQMTTAITNLIANAKRHGFVDSNKKYTIRFEVGLTSNQQEVTIVCKNDGRPFPSNFSFEDFISFGNYAGQTGHSGIGGYLIHRIIENHNGQLQYRRPSNPHNPYKVQFEITLPIEPYRVLD